MALFLCTGWPFRLIQTSRWLQNKSSVLIHGPHTKTELLFSCQREVWQNLNVRHVETSCFLGWDAKNQPKQSSETPCLHLWQPQVGVLGEEGDGVVGRDSSIILISAEGCRELEGVVGAVTDPLQVLHAVKGQLCALMYRVTHYFDSNLPLTPKHRLPFSTWFSY